MEATVLTAAVGCSTLKVTCPVTLSVGGVQHAVDIQVDTGATCSLLSMQLARRLFKGTPYQSSSARLFGFGRVTVSVASLVLVAVTVQFGVDLRTVGNRYTVDTPGSCICTSMYSKGLIASEYRDQ